MMAPSENRKSLRIWAAKKIEDIRERKREYILRTLLIAGTALIDAAVIMAMVLPDLTPLPSVDSGLVFMIPVLSGLILGLLLTEESYKIRAVSGLYTIVLSCIIVFISLYWPILSGVATDFGFYMIWSMKWTMMAALIITPTTLMGVLLGASTADY